MWSRLYLCRECQMDLTNKDIWAGMCLVCFQKSWDFNASVKDVMTSKPRERMMSDGLTDRPIKYGTPGKAGVKHDGEKLMWYLLPWKAVQGMIKVLTFGANKYSPNGWRTVPNAKERYLSALLRHLHSMQAGEKLDPESGLRHVDHMLTNAAFLAELED